MALDVHLGTGSQNTSWQFAIDVKTHRGIFLNSYVQTGRVELILRLQDYYSDCSFETQELSQLNDELRLLASSYPANHLMKEFCVKFSKVCKVGMAEGLNLYFFCD
jgi:hypothetical protein